jgi:hypothetical protein
MVVEEATTIQNIQRKILRPCSKKPGRKAGQVLLPANAYQ